MLLILKKKTNYQVDFHQVTLLDAGQAEILKKWQQLLRCSKRKRKKYQGIILCWEGSLSIQLMFNFRH